MPITAEELEHLTHLAHLELDPNEFDQMREEISTVLDHVSRLQSVDTQDVPATAYAVPLDNVLREDEVLPSWTPDQVLSNAPRRVDNFFEVQAVFD